MGIFKDKSKIHILALSWRDIKAPKMGGAEVYTHAMLSRMDMDKYEIVHLSPMFEGAKAAEKIDGIKYIRRGNILSVLIYAFRYYRKNKNDIDYVIDQCNTHRFFTPLYVPASKRVLLIHQLTREIWYINAKFPLSFIGYHLESAWLKIYKKGYTLTVSESTRDDLVALGFDKDKIKIVNNGLDESIFEFARKSNITESTDSNNCFLSGEYTDKKLDDAKFIYAGRYASYKGIDICVEALGIVKKRIKNAKLYVIGKKNDEYIEKVLKPIADKYKLKISYDGNECMSFDMHNEMSDDMSNTISSDITKRYDETDADIILCGFVSEDEKYRLMKESSLLLFPSMREGWGIIVSEAGLLGTPSLVMDAPGMRDSVDKGRAGYMCTDRTAVSFAKKILEIYDDKETYHDMCNRANEFASKFNWGGRYIEQSIRSIEKSIFS